MANRLIEPTIEYDAGIQEFLRDMTENGSSMDGCASLKRCGSTREWLDRFEAFKSEENVPAGMTPCLQFIYVREEDGKVLGMLQIRLRSNEIVEKYAGHIGYSVAPSERRKGYAAEMLRLSLPICAEIGLRRVLISCRPENEGSRRTILKNGGRYISTAYWPERDVFLERYVIEV